jgi:hypothetical protein
MTSGPFSARTCTGRPTSTPARSRGRSNAWATGAAFAKLTAVGDHPNVGACLRAISD